MDISDTPKIICPFCNYQYLPAEIYIPAVFFGKPSKISKNSDGTLEYMVGNPMDLQESYICDRCDNKFYIKADLSFKTSTSLQLEQKFVLKRK